MATMCFKPVQRFILAKKNILGLGALLDSSLQDLLVAKIQLFQRFLLHD